jgi:hypothetical protein
VYDRQNGFRKDRKAFPGWQYRFRRYPDELAAATLAQPTPDELGQTCGDQEYNQQIGDL